MIRIEAVIILNFSAITIIRKINTKIRINVVNKIPNNRLTSISVIYFNPIVNLLLIEQDEFDRCGINASIDLINQGSIRRQLAQCCYIQLMSSNIINYKGIQFWSRIAVSLLCQGSNLVHLDITDSLSLSLYPGTPFFRSSRVITG